MTMPATTEKPKRYSVKVDGKEIAKAELRRVPVDAIRLDHAYQRDTSAPWVEQHRPFDPQQAGAIVLSHRAGSLFCIDGGHRLALARADGITHITHINAFVVEGLTQADEARLFTRYQRERRNLTSHALFRADVVSGDAETLALVRVVHAAGFTLERKGGTNNITAIDSLRSIQRLGGDDLLARTLELVGRHWLGETKSLSGQVLKGLAIFLKSAGQQPSFSRDRLEKVMETMAPVKVIRLANGVADKRRASSVGPGDVAEAIYEQYQKSLTKNELPLGPLTIGDKRRPGPKGEGKRT